MDAVTAGNIDHVEGDDDWKIELPQLANEKKVSFEVVGINDLIFTESGANDGVGFAISIDLAKLVADQLVAGEAVELALLGVSTMPSGDGSPGAVVESVTPGSAAETFGLQPGDRIIAADGDTIRDSTGLRADIIARSPGSDLDLTIVRDGAEVVVTVTLGSINT